LVAGDNGTQWGIPGAQCLCAGHDIRLDTEMLMGEPKSGSSESGDHFVDNEEDAIPVANLPDAGPIILGGNLHTVGLHDWLADQGSHMLWTFQLDLPLEVPDADFRVGFVVQPVDVSVAGRTGNETVSGNARIWDFTDGKPIGN